MEQYQAQAIDLLKNYGPKVLMVIVILIVGLKVIGIISRTMDKVLAKKDFDPTLRPFICSMIAWALKVLLFISIAGMVGIETTSFVAVLGASSLAIGLALQGSLANFAGGVLILILRPYNIGDYISAEGSEGVVEKIDIFATIVNTVDNQKVIIPNGPLAAGKIINVTGQGQRRVDLAVGIGYDDDIDKAIQALVEMCNAHSKVLKDPGTFVGITDYGDNSINLTIRPWCKTADYWDVFFECNRGIKSCLDKAGVSIPYPQRDVHMITS